MIIDKRIERIQKRILQPLYADITRTLEVTCYKRGPKNHGSNFVGNAVVLSGIETVAQFTDPDSEEKQREFVEKAKSLHKALTPEQKQYLSWRDRRVPGSELARDFMKKYFDSVFSKKELGTRVYELVWAFRNPHMHAFYPYYEKRFNNKTICGGVMWLYGNRTKKTGIRIKTLETRFESKKQKLYRIEDEWFLLCPQILFVYFKRAVERFLEEVLAEKSVQCLFLQNYSRLARRYNLDPVEDP